MRSNLFSIIVYGEPIPQGSKSVTKTGRMYEANKKLDPWRKKIAKEASDVMEAVGHEPMIGPCKINLNFYFPRPKSHSNALGVIKASAPEYKQSKPDLDKLIRAVGDALTGIVVKDDSQFVQIEAAKFYTGQDRQPAGVSILIRELP